jgi:type VI secretion system protein ImpM
MSSRVCGDSAIAGTFIPSVDQVGRNYPFAIVKEITQAPIQVWSDQTWSEKLEPWILATLDDDFYLEPWLEMLCKEDMSWPEMQPVTASVVQSERQTKSQMIESVNDSTLSQLGLLHQSYTDLYGRYCLWWTQGSEEVPPCLLVTSGLPQVSQFSAMLDGNWERWGWQQKQIVG